MVSGRPNPTLHHCHGGSMLEIVGFVNPGVAQKSSDWLVIPLGAYFHTGPFGIDNGQGRYKSVHQWELAFGRQVDFLDRVCRELGYNVWEHAGIEREVT
jgi:hypothetical protein